MEILRMKGLSGKEMNVVSWLELEEKRFFTRLDIQTFFRNKNEMRVYIHRLKNKGRIVKLNNNKYYLVPIKAYKGRWSEHPFVVIDEIFNSKDYFVGGKAAAYYWEYIEQIPIEYDVYSTKKQGSKEIFGVKLNFKR
ncbi:MAG: hypothetical protein KKG60_01215, partial [Nanoarchaeota archaeon]|nr:hypothetical protein [Nanoarchaeota archaeon]